MGLFLLFLGLALGPSSPALAQHIDTPVVYSTTTAESIIDSYADKYGVDKKTFLAVAECESQLYEKAFNKNDPNGGSKGVFQFQQSTFTRYSKEAGIVGGDVWNPRDNIETAAYMFSKGQERQWSCFKEITKPLGQAASGL